MNYALMFFLCLRTETFPECTAETLEPVESHEACMELAVQTRDQLELLEATLGREAVFLYLKCQAQPGA